MVDAKGGAMVKEQGLIPMLSLQLCRYISQPAYNWLVGESCERIEQISFGAIILFPCS